MEKIYYTVYKVTNKINGMFYIGTHKTRNLDDGYMGSGKYLKRSIEKNGLEVFEREILFVFDNPNDMFSKEAEIVNEHFLADDATYNLKLGGSGGFDYINSNPHRYLTVKRLGSLMSADELQRRWRAKYDSDPDFRARRRQHSLASLEKSRRLYPDGPFKGRQHSTETKQRMSQAAKGKRSGSDNSQYGTRWIHNTELKVSRKLKKSDALPDGWREGRKLKFNDAEL